MKVEAIKVEKGFLIPFNEILEKINKNKIILDIEIIEEAKLEEGYAILDEMVGFCESNKTDASIGHDEIIYKLEPKK